MMNIKKFVEKYSQRRSVKYFVPFFLFIVGGSIGLREFTKLRYQYRTTLTYQRKLDKCGLELNNPEEVTLENKYKQLQEVKMELII